MRGMGLRMVLGAVIASVAVAGAIALSNSSDEAQKTARPEFVTAASLEAKAQTTGVSKAEWIAMHPPVWWRQIQMICNLSTADARRYDRQLGPRFRASVLQRLRSDCAA